MANVNRRAGVLFFKIDGVQHDAKGSFTYSLGQPERKIIKGPDRVHGYSELPGEPMLEGEITDRVDFDLKKFCNITDANLTLELANGKVISFRSAWYSGDGKVSTEEANIKVQFHALEAEEIK